MHQLTRRALVALAATATAAATAAVAPAQAAVAPQTAGGGYGHTPKVTVLSKDVLLPFNLALNRNRVYVADGALNAVLRLPETTPFVAGPKDGEIAGIAFARDQRTFAYVGMSPKSAFITIRSPHKKPVTANLKAFEAKYNPDKKVRYGIDHPTACQTAGWKKIEKDFGPINYKGLVDSHPYSVVSRGKSWIVAEAAGNDLLSVDAKGRVKVLTVLPRQPFRFTPEAAKSFGLPGCFAGAVYNFESVPTDVEVGPHGQLYVSTLPGGPEGGVPGLEKRGSVYRVDPRTGRATKIATGFTGATNLAVTRHGTVYVAELGAGRISKVVNRRPQEVVALKNVAGLEWYQGRLYASTIAEFGETGPKGNGTVVRID